MKKITYLLALFLVAQTAVFAQYTAIPDPNFEAALSFYDDIAMDGQIPTASAVAETGTLGVGAEGITDFTGIEAFTEITSLNVNYNDMTSLDLSSNTKLVTITAQSCWNMTSINVSGLTVLEGVFVRYSALTQLDLSDNLALTDVDVSRQTSAGANSAPYVTLTNIDMSGGDRSGVITFNASFNDNLACVFVDDTGAAYLAGWTVDSGGFCMGSLSTEDRQVSAFSMYPNPAKSIVLIGSKTQSSTLDVYSVSGKLVLSKELSFGDNNVNITSLASGLYLARFSAENKIETKKLVIN